MASLQRLPLIPWTTSSTAPRANQSRHTVCRGRPTRSASSPTRRCVSAARRARLPARNGTTSRRTAWCGPGTPTTTPARLGASTWRHVKFVEIGQLGPQDTGATKPGGSAPLAPGQNPFGWLFLSDVCKHCENAGCLEACPTGAIFRTEVGSVYVQDDVCNGCGYCVVGCPFGVIDRRPAPQRGAGGAFKCTFCYDRQIDGAHTGVRQGVPDRVDPVRSARRAACARTATSARSARTRLCRRARLRSARHFGRRHPRHRAPAGESGAGRAAREAGGADHLPARGVAVGGDHFGAGDRRGVRRFRAPLTWPRSADGTERPSIASTSCGTRLAARASCPAPALRFRAVRSPSCPIPTRAATTASRSSSRRCGPGRSGCISSSAGPPG